MTSGRLKLWHKVIIGMILGTIAGEFVGTNTVYFKCVGEIFINMIKMVVVPLVFFSILNGVTNLSDASTFNRMGTKALSYYMMTTAFAVVIGLLLANIFEPGAGVNISLSHDAAHSTQTIMGIVMNIVPSNPIKSMAEGNTVQVVVFALFTGFCLIKIGDRGREVKNFIISATHLVFKMIELITKLTPYGVFAIMTWVVGTYGLGVILSLGKFCLVVFGALVVQYLLFGLMLIFFAKLNPLPFYRKMIETQTLAFATASSKAALSIADHTLRHKLGVSKQSASFVLPLGTSMNMDGTAIYLGICCVFFAQIVGMHLGFEQYLTIIFTATVGSIGAAGFPGGSMVMMGMVLSSVGLPLEGMSLIIGVDRFLEMLRTVINITGDCTVTVIVDQVEGNFNKKLYYAKEQAKK